MMMMNKINFKKAEKDLDKVLNILYELEDKTNYDIKKLGRAITLLQEVDIVKEFFIHNEKPLKQYVCPKCSGKVYPSIVKGYYAQCFNCDEDFYGFELIEKGGKK
jgi:hypothetical protein